MIHSYGYKNAHTSINISFVEITTVCGTQFSKKIFQ